MKRLVLLFSLVFFLTGLMAQDPIIIFEEDFDGGLNTFTTTAGDPVGATWKWSPDGRADSVEVDGQKIAAAFWPSGGQSRPPIQSPSAANGAAMFNSDAYDSGGDPDGNIGDGPLPGPHTDTLTSPIIDCSNYANVSLSFYQYVRTFTGDNTLVQVSGDGGQTWTDFPVNFRRHSNEVTATSGNSISTAWKMLDISEIAGNSPEVQVRFIWDGIYFFWLIDDVQILGDVGNNLTITDFFNPASNYLTPVQHIDADTFGFFAAVSNFGTVDQTNVVLRASVIDGTGEELFADSVTIETLPAGYRDSLLQIEENFPPELDEGVYAVIYEVRSDDENDYYPIDNLDAQDFVVSQNIFSKDEGALFDFAEWPSGLDIGGVFGNYQIGNYFALNPLAGEGFRATTATFNAFLPGADNFTGTETITILVYKVKEGVDPNFGNFNFFSKGEATEDDDLEIVGFGSFTVPADYDPVSGEMEVELEDFNLGGPVALEAGGRYFLVAQYEGANNRKVFHSMSDDIVYPFIPMVVFIPDNSGQERWFFGFTGLDELSPIMRMTLDFANSVDETPLPESAMRLFPNPVSDNLSVELDLMDSSPAVIFIADMSGKVILMREYDNVQRETFNFDVSNYPAGTYLLRVGTEEGTKTRKFVINR